MGLALNNTAYIEYIKGKIALAVTNRPVFITIIIFVREND
jgi:hypothetical protein